MRKFLQVRSFVLVLFVIPKAKWSSRSTPSKIFITTQWITEAAQPSRAYLSLFNHLLGHHHLFSDLFTPSLPKIICAVWLKDGPANWRTEPVSWEDASFVRICQRTWSDSISCYMEPGQRYSRFLMTHSCIDDSCHSFVIIISTHYSSSIIWNKYWIWPWSTGHFLLYL